MATEFIARKANICPALKSPRGKEIIKIERKYSKDSYLFDIIKADY
jgi:hypothetical protein